MASVLCLQIALPLFLITDMPQPGQTSGFYQVMAVAQEPNNRAAPDFLHGVLFKENASPGTVFYIQPAAGDGHMNMRMLVELSAVRMQRAEDTDLHALSAGPP